MLRYASFSTLAAFLVLASGCDSQNPAASSQATVEFGGVEVSSYGNSTLTTERSTTRSDGGAALRSAAQSLVVSGVGDSGNDGFFIPGTPDRIDVLTVPISQRRRGKSSGSR